MKGKTIIFTAGFTLLLIIGTALGCPGIPASTKPFEDTGVEGISL